MSIIIRIFIMLSRKTVGVMEEPAIPHIYKKHIR